MFERWITIARSHALAGLFTLLGIGFLGVGSAQLLPEFNPSADPEVTPSPTSTSDPSPIATPADSANIGVDVQGAVNTPGLYILPAHSRISDALAAAGELSNQADSLWVARNLNRAVKLSDGDKLYIPKKGEIKTNQSCFSQHYPKPCRPRPSLASPRPSS